MLLRALKLFSIHPCASALTTLDLLARPLLLLLVQCNARPNAVEQVLTAFKHALAKQGWKGAAAAADKSEL
jgi:hypothetical protein